MKYDKTKKADEAAQKMYNAYEINAERERAEHLRNLQRGMIGQQPKQKKPFAYHLVQTCMSALLIAFTLWLIKVMLF